MQQLVEELDQERKKTKDVKNAAVARAETERKIQEEEIRRQKEENWREEEIRTQKEEKRGEEEKKKGRGTNQASRKNQGAGRDKT